ncbi:hypothetical protein GSI_03458 [Ganoderma sinense ZZ0214-1]|uniref:Uncharacterized protein n=1 Tax=Ganoderma sinense ZZ0214-1 TaxID=1077348 RepID=A0A2G8SM74_9APHY|nr:hypothetical protein GSI_03458 [Ganoderma sinense ZZ0214-1]
MASSLSVTFNPDPVGQQKDDRFVQLEGKNLEGYEVPQGPHTRSVESPLPKRKLGTSIRLNVSVVALAIASEIRAVANAASSAVAKVISCSPSRASDQHAGRDTLRTPVFIGLGDNAYDVSNEDAPLEDDLLDALDDTQAAVSTITKTSFPTSKRAKHNQAHKKKQRLAEAIRQKQAGVQLMKSSLVSVVRNVRAVFVNVDLGLSRHTQSGVPPSPVTFPVTSTGFTGHYVPPVPGDNKASTAPQLYQQGFSVLEWDGREPHALVDSNDRVFMMLAGSPKDEHGWLAVRHAAERQMRRLAATFKFAKSPKTSRRGNYRSVTCGILFGGGQPKPMNSAVASRNDKIVQETLGHPAIRRIVGFINGAFKLFAPAVHAEYARTLDGILASDESLVRLFPNGVFAAATFNCGRRVATLPHTDSHNYAPGWCAVMALGDFNARYGGHLVLWDLKLMIEFPAGAVIFLPSAILRHSNTAGVYGGGQSVGFKHRRTSSVEEVSSQ